MRGNWAKCSKINKKNKNTPAEQNSVVTLELDLVHINFVAKETKTKTFSPNVQAVFKNIT